MQGTKIVNNLSSIQCIGQNAPTQKYGTRHQTMFIDWQALDTGENDITLTGIVGQIQAIVHIPRNFRPTQASAIAICCHPHPLYHGTMHNKVVHMLAKTFQKLGIMAVRFNFRGVEKSEGCYDEGRGESEDLKVICADLRSAFPQAALFLSGFSFGSYVASRVAAEVGCNFLISVAPPVTLYDFNRITYPACPWLVVMGDEDEIVDSGAVYQWIDSAEVSIDLIRYTDTGHFFHGKMARLGRDLHEYLSSRLEL